MKNCNRAFVLLLLAAFLYVMQACKTDPPVNPDKPDEYGTLYFKINTNASGQAVGLKQDFQNANGWKYNLSKILFYLGDIKLTSTAGTAVPLKDLVLVDFANPIQPTPYDSSVIGTGFRFKVKTGNYTGIQYGIGVPPLLNGMVNGTFNPSQYPNDHPLSVYRGTAWSWAGYLFTMIEGKEIDSTGANKSLIYHVATDSFYTPVSHSLPIEIKKNTTTTLNMSLDVNELFYNGPGNADNLNPVGENVTHTTGEVEKAISGKFMRNLSRALQPQ